MPTFLGSSAAVVESTAVQLDVLLRIQNTDLVVSASEPTPAIMNWMYVEFRRAWLAGQFSQSLSQLFLEIIVKAVLLSEKDDPTLRDYCVSNKCPSIHHDILTSDC